MYTGIWNYLFIPKLQRLYHLSLTMNKYFRPTFTGHVITYPYWHVQQNINISHLSEKPLWIMAPHLLILCVNEWQTSTKQISIYPWCYEELCISDNIKIVIVSQMCIHTLTLSQWSSSGNPVAIRCAWKLDPSVHWNATGEMPVCFQWSSSGFPVVFQCVPIMLINTGSPLGHHWVLASASVVPVASQCTCGSSGLPVCSNYAN